MKKIYIFLILSIMINSSIWSQESPPISKGSILFGFSGRFQRAAGDLQDDYQVSTAENVWENYNRTDVILSLNSSFFMIDNVALGCNFSTSGFSRGKYGENLLGTGVNISYFLGNTNSTIFPNASLGINYNNWSHKNGASSDVLNMSASVGVMYMINKATGLQFELLDIETPEKFLGKQQIKQSVIVVQIGFAFFPFK